MHSRFSRRRLVGAGAAMGSMAGLSMVTRSAGAQATSSTPVASPGAGGWSFTDDRGITVSLPQTPTRVIAQTSSAATLWDFGFEVIGYLGPNDSDNPAGFPQVGDMDVAAMTNLGDYGALDLEKVLQIDPDLYVDVDRGGGALWYLDEDSQPLLEEICPTVGLDTQSIPVVDIVRRYEDLAVSLGVDAKSEALVAARETHEAAETSFAEAMAATPELRVLTISSGDPGTVLIWNPDWLCDLIYMRGLGMNTVHAGAGPDEPNTLLSMEVLGNYPADVILVDVREDITALDGNPVWESLPAVQAGQIGRWYAAFPYSYQKLADVLDLTRETLASAQHLG